MLTYLFVFFSAIDFSRGVILQYLLSRGLGYEQAGIAQSILFMSTVLCEVPTGYLSDRFGRKLSLGAGTAMLALGFLLLFTNVPLWLVYVAFALKGLGFAFLSGTQEAYIYDQSLDEADYLKLSSRCRALSKISLCLGIFAGGAIADAFQLKLAIIASFTSMAMAAGISLFLKTDSRREGNAAAKKSEAAPARTGLLLLRPQVLKIILIMLLLEAAHTPAFMLAQLLLRQHEFANTSIALVLVAATLAASLASILAPRVRHVAFAKLCAYVAAIQALVLFASYFFTASWALSAFIVVLNAGPFILFVHLDNFLHKLVDSSNRATLFSYYSLFSSAFISLSYCLSGLVSDAEGIRLGYASLLVFAVLSFVLASSIAIRERGNEYDGN